MSLMTKAGVPQNPVSSITVAMDDATSEKSKQNDIADTTSIVFHVVEQYNRSRRDRRTKEIQWLKNYLNYRGRYGDEVKFRDTEVSRVFLKVTKTKVIAAYSMIVDTLFNNGKIPITIDPTPRPEGIAEAVHLDPQDKSPDESVPTDVYGHPGDGNNPDPGATQHSLSLGPYQKKLEDLSVKEGPGLTPTSATFEPAMKAAKRMEKKIHDQMDEAGTEQHICYAAFENVLFGEGIVKGPTAITKEYPKWNEQGDYEPVTKTMPKTDMVSIWNAYPDPDARGGIEDCEYFVERHRMSKSQLRALKKIPYFRKEIIEEAISIGFNYIPEWWESKLTEAQNESQIERYEVLEYWGVADREMVERHGLDLPKEFKDLDEVQINAWICNHKCLRLVFNPFTPKRLPYHAVPHEINPYNFFGIGLADNCEDTQTILNGFWRLAIDNAVLSGNVMLEIDENMLAPGQDTRLYPGKQFKRISGQPGQAIYPIQVPNITGAIFQMVDKARQYMDEATGQPSYSYGQTGVSGTTRTASGMSMLMGAATVATKAVIKNFDNYLLRSLGEAFFAFNMQFDYDPECNGDLEVNARGVESLMKNEVRSQRLAQFGQVMFSNPVTMPLVKAEAYIRDYAQTLDIDPDRMVNSPAEALAQAMLIAAAGQAPGVGSPPGAPPTGPGPTGNGGGTVGSTATPPAPGQQGFSANNGNGGGAGQP
jgi:hypothetical protein